MFTYTHKKNYKHNLAHNFWDYTIFIKYAILLTNMIEISSNFEILQ